MLQYRFLKMLLVVLAAFCLTACGGSDDDDNSINGGGSGSINEPVTIANFKIDFQGPGGHSNGAFGNTNALHAAARAVVALENECNSKGVKFYVQELSGGNSVNSIAAAATVRVGLVSGTDAATFKAMLEQAATAGMNAENAFRKVSTGQTDANKLRKDIRFEPIEEV